MTDTQDAWAHSSNLSVKLVTSLANETWVAATSPQLADWYLDLLSKILALTKGERIVYLTSLFVLNDHGRVIAFTETGVVNAEVVISRGSVESHATRWSRGSLLSVKVEVATRVASNDESWPRAEQVSLEYEGRTVRLPADPDNASMRNRRELDALMPSLLIDLG